MGRKKRWIRITMPCTGCFESVDGHVPYQDGKPIYEFDEKARCYRGAGCSECGHTGKRRNEYDLQIIERVARKFEQEKRGNENKESVGDCGVSDRGVDAISGVQSG